MKQDILKILAYLLIICVTNQVQAQGVTNEQYKAAQAAIENGATYYIYTCHNGSGEGSTKYYLTDNGSLIRDVSKAGIFKFNKLEVSGDSFYKPESWQFSQYFTNPDCEGGLTEKMIHLGYIRSNINVPDLQRKDWESQVWFKKGETYAVRATNSSSSSWGGNTFWTVVKDTDGDGLPNADYSLTPLFTWRLEKIGDGPTPPDLSVKDVKRLTKLPHVYINTFTGYDIYSKSTYVLARMWYVDEQDNVTFYDSLQIRGRGNATWSMEKKPYKLKFQQKEKLLGKGYANAKKWTLLANHGDKTLIRNALASLVGEWAGLKFNPAAKFVDLTLNDQYVGNYQFSDQIDVRPHRVKITEQDTPLTEESDITGGYLLEADGSHDFHTDTYWDYMEQRNLAPDGFTSSKSAVPIRIHYPEAEDLDQKQVNYIRKHITNFETRLFASYFNKEDRGYRPLVDSTSLANWYICTELTANVDGFWSTYFYKEAGDDRLFWGPLWDYDIAFNNDNRSREGRNCNTTLQMMIDVGYGNVKAWIQRMWKDPWFKQLIYRRYAELIDGGMEQYLNEKIDSLTQLMDASIQLNYQRWSISTQTLREIVLYSTYDEYVTDLRTFLAKHIPFLKENFAKRAGIKPDPGPEEKKPDFNANAGVFYTISNLGTGTVMDVSLETEDVCANSHNAESQSQHWVITPLKNGYMFITNRLTGHALNDPTQGEPTATTETGTQLNVVKPDSLDVRQQWDIISQGEGHYNLVCHFSDHAANLMGGSTEDGTAILSWTSDERNGSSANRLWVIDEVRDQGGNRIEGLEEDVDYALAYDSQNGRLHFGADDLTGFRFPVRVYDQSGCLVQTFQADQGTTLNHLPKGLYIVTWNAMGRKKSVKLVR